MKYLVKTGIQKPTRTEMIEDAFIRICWLSLGGFIGLMVALQVVVIMIEASM